MSLLRNNYKSFFKAFILFAVLYNGYRYFFPWDIHNGYKPLSPFYISLLKDVPWAIIVFIGLYCLYRNKKLHTEYSYRESDNFSFMKRYFVITHLLLLAIAIIHLFHKNPIDVLQRDIKNVQYVFLPFILPLIIENEKDIRKHLNWLFIIGLFVCIFGYISYMFIPSFMWEDKAALSTFQSPICFGTFAVMLFLILLARILTEKEHLQFWNIALCIFYGSILMTASFAALLSMIVGTLFILIIVRPNMNTLLKVGTFLVISSLFFYPLGLFNNYIEKGINSVNGYKAMREIQLNEVKSTEEKPKTDNNITTPPSLTWEFVSKPYEPTPDNTYTYNNIQYTSIAGRMVNINEILTYLKTAHMTDILWGDFSLKNHFEYDNTYFYFIKNDGIVFTVLLLVLLCSGIFTGIKKYVLFIKSGNSRMAGLSLGIAAFLFVSTLIQFNLSYFLTIYPHNFLTYFFLVLMFFLNPSDHNSKQSSGTVSFDEK